MTDHTHVALADGKIWMAVSQGDVDAFMQDALVEDLSIDERGCVKGYDHRLKSWIEFLPQEVAKERYNT